MKFVALSEQKEWHGAEKTRPKAEPNGVVMLRRKSRDKNVW
jgi:hypothetical protein